MTLIFEFTTYLRIAAANEAEAYERANALADAVSHGDATLALDESSPCVEEVPDDERE